MANRSLVALLALIALLGVLIQLAVTPMLAAVAADLDSTSALVGQAVTVTFLAGAVLGLIVGPMGDHYGHRRLLMIGGALAAGSAFASAAAPEYWTFLISRIPGGLGGGMLAAISVVIASTRLPEAERRAGIGWIFTAFSAAPILGFPLITEIGDRLHWRAAMVALGVLLLIGLVLVRIVIDPDRQRATEPFRIGDTLRAYIPILRDANALSLQVSNFLRTVAAFTVVTYLGAYLMEEQGMSLQHVGYVYVILGIGYLAGTRLGDGRFIAASLRVLYLLTTLVLAVAFAIPFAFSLEPIPTTLILLLGNIAMSSGFLMITILISEEAPTGQSTALMLRQAGFACGNATAGALGGMLLTFGGYALVGTAVLGFTLMAAAIGYWPIVRAGSYPDPARSGSD